MWKLSGIVVGPRGTMPLILYLYDPGDGTVLCTDLQGKGFYSLNLTFGYLRVADRNLQGLILMAKGGRYSSYSHSIMWMNQDTRKAEEFKGVTLDSEELCDKEGMLAAPAASPELIQTLSCLVSRQVSGDEILKGLRVRDIVVSGKLQMSYIGGWNYFVNGTRDTVRYFLNEVILSQLGK